MEALLERTAMSAFIREKKDFYTALFDAAGAMAVGSDLPIFGDIVGPVTARYPLESMQPGDLYWYNDCYGSRGAVSHSNDQVFLAPVFLGADAGRLRHGLGAFLRYRRPAPRLAQPRCHRPFPGRHHHPARRAWSAAARPTRTSLRAFWRNCRFPAQSAGRHQRADGRRPPRREAGRGDRRPLRRRGPGRRLRPAPRPHRDAGPRQAARRLPHRHHPLRRYHRHRRPRQRPLHPPPGADPHAGRPLHPRRHRDRRPGHRPGEPADAPGRAGHGARPLLPPGRGRAGAATPAAPAPSTRCGCARARCSGPARRRRSACAASP